MKKYIVKIAALLVFSIFVFCGFGMNAYAITTDGIFTESDWKKAPAVVLENQRSFNNKVKSAVVKTVEDRKNGYVYLAVMIEFDKGGNPCDGAVKLSVNGAAPVIIKTYGKADENGEYPIRAGSDIDEVSNCSVTEIEVFFKDGLSSSDNIKINIIDFNGTESGAYTVTVKEKEPEPTSAVKTEKPTEPKTTRTTTTKTTVTKTTATKTSSIKTTKTAKTSNSTIVKTSADENTSAEKTDSTEKTSEEDFTFKKVVKTTSETVSAQMKKIKKTKQQKTPSKSETYEDAVYENEQPVSKSKTTAVKENVQSESGEVFSTDAAESGKSRKYSFVAVGSLCAAALAAAAVAVAVKSSKKDD